MKYWGEFRTIHDNTKYKVEFFDEGSATSYGDELILGDNPCIISRQSNNLFDPIKPHTCTIEIYTKEFLPALYNYRPHGIEVKVTRDPGNTEYITFHGFVTPCMYTQSFTYADTIQIECIDAISTLQYFNYTYENGQYAQNLSVYSILKRACQVAGYDGAMIWMNSLTPNIQTLRLNEGNFFDDDELHTPWNWLEVVEEICKFLGWSCCPQGDSVYFTDYRYLSKITQTGSTPFQYSTTSIWGSSTGYSTAWGYYLDWRKGSLPYAAGSPTLSLDEVYNKIEISANTYNIDKIIPKIDDPNEHISINKEQNDFDYTQEVVTTGTHKNWFWGKKYETFSGMPGFWSAYCRLDESNGWKHHFYNIRDYSEITSGEYKYYYDSYRDPRAGALTNSYRNSAANRMITTLCALPCHYSFDSTTGTSVNWNDCLMVLKYSNMSYINYRHQFVSAENTLSSKPLLTYENDDCIIYKPASGVTYITLKGDILYQTSISEQDNGTHSLFIVNTSEKVYATVPFDGENKVGEHTFKSSGHPLYTGVGTYRIPGQDGYGSGFSLVPMKVSVGDKWWNGSSWQDTETVFYLKHTNEPDPNSEDDSYEYVDTFKWLKLVPNTTFVQKVGDECYAIPIASNDNDAPSSGRLKIELMIPRFLPLEFTGDIFPTTDNRHQSIAHTWDTKGPCMYIKGFEANIVYVDSTAWWLDSNDKGSDIVYSNVVNSGYCNEFNGLELKINTTVDEKPISKSFINDGDTYIKSMKHYFGDLYKPQEENLIDMYYEHYSKPAKIYTFNANTQLNPYHKFTFGDTLSGTFVLDSYVMDLRNENTEFKVIEYESDLD